MSGVFVSYRRDDSQGFAGRLTDDLADVLGPDRVFRDIEIPVGSDFSDVLHRAIAASDALLVVIGRHWAAQGERGHGARLFEPTDWVRTEIEAALAQRKQVIPVLVGGAAMPPAAALPDSIARLSRLQAATLSDRRWDADIGELAERLRTLCPALASPQPPQRADRESPAEVLRELGERVLGELGSRRRPGVPPPLLPRSLGRRVLRVLGRGARRLLGIAAMAALIYAGIRLFGDPPMLSALDAFEARLQIGWERLQGYLARL
jgi:hypothetical protein